MLTALKYWFIRIGLAVIMLDVTIGLAIIFGIWFYGK
jgi:hypothetical protein